MWYTSDGVCDTEVQLGQIKSSWALECNCHCQPTRNSASEKYTVFFSKNFQHKKKREFVISSSRELVNHFSQNWKLIQEKGRTSLKAMNFNESSQAKTQIPPLAPKIVKNEEEKKNVFLKPLFSSRHVKTATDGTGERNRWGARTLNYKQCLAWSHHKTSKYTCLWESIFIGICSRYNWSSSD